MKTMRDMKQDPGPNRKKDNGDIIACQFISAFSWILLILLVNFFLLHRSNTIPEAEARLTEPEVAVRTPDLPLPVPLKTALLQKPMNREAREEFLEDDYKPNYYFLYRDQIRYVDIVAEKKVKVAKKAVHVSVPPMPREEPEPREIPEPRPLKLEWVDMAILEETEPEKILPVDERPRKPVPRTVKVAMVRDVDLDIAIRKDVPIPLVREEPKQLPQEPIMPVRVSAADLDMEIMEQARPKEAVREVVNVKQPKQTAVRSLPSADYLTLSMEFSSDAATGRQAVTGAVQGEAQVTNRSVHLAKAHAAPQADLSMSLDFGKETEGVPGPKAGRVAPAKRSAAGLVAARGVGGLEMSSGLLMGQGTGRGNAQDSSKGVAVQQAPARMILRNAKGSIPLGAPLSFRLAEVGKETQSGSAYLRGSTQL